MAFKNIYIIFFILIKNPKTEYSFLEKFQKEAFPEANNLYFLLKNE